MDQVAQAQNIHEELNRTPTIKISKDKATNESFQYLPLDRSIERTFRLLTLLPSPKGSQPRCTLSLNMWGDCSYEALSYVWGDSELKRPIILDENTFEVTENLFLALSHLQLEDHPRVMWIDAICIDQDSIKERNHQVASMGDIYNNCQRVVIWLGEEDTETKSTINFIKSTFDEIEQKITASPQYRDWDSLIELYESEIKDDILKELFRLESFAGWKNFEHILQRTWWTRAWVVQEFAKAPDAIFYIGDFSMNWTLISTLIIIFFEACNRDRESSISVLSDFDRVTISAADELVHARLNTQLRNFMGNFSTSKQLLSQIGFDFILLLRGQSSRMCSDPNDRIYSILSMMDSRFSKTLQPDYSKPAGWTNLAVVRTYINISKKLDILACATEALPAKYPSWCPDWSLRAPSEIIDLDPRYNLYRTSGTSEAAATFSQNESTVYVKGLLLGTVVDNNFQNSRDDFSYKKDDGVRSNWDIKLMAQKFQHVMSSFDISLSRNDLNFSTNECEQNICFNIITTTLLAGYWHQFLSPPPLEKDLKTGDWWPGGKKREFLSIAARRSLNKTMVLCHDGKLGLAPKKTKNGDEIWIFMGASVPFVLRGLDEMDGDKRVYQLIGTVYVYGVMKGEAMEDLEKGKYKEEIVALR